MKKHIGKDAILPAMPVVIIATENEGKINFAPHGQIATATADPTKSTIYTSVVKEHMTAQNILKTKEFSVNVPMEDMLDKLLYCGSVSGKTVDKSGQFAIFKGNTNIPMIKDCPISFACKLVETVELNGFYIFIGEVLETYADEACLNDNSPDTKKARPILCSIDGKFWQVGSEIK